jgi:hypothetical protein
MRRPYDAAVAGGIVMVLVMLLALPVAVMVTGMLWSALTGVVLSDDADARAGGQS